MEESAVLAKMALDSFAEKRGENAETGLQRNHEKARALLLRMLSLSDLIC